MPRRGTKISSLIGFAATEWAFGPVDTFSIHVSVIASLGAYVFDALDLEALAATAARLNRWEFMVTINPIAVMGGTGSLVNAVATF